MKIEKLTHTYRNPNYVEPGYVVKDGVYNVEWKEVTLQFPHTVVIDKINELIDAWNSQQEEECGGHTENTIQCRCGYSIFKEEKKTLCWTCYNKGRGKKVEDITIGLTKCDYCEEDKEECEVSKHKGYCIDCEDKKEEYTLHTVGEPRVTVPHAMADKEVVVKDQPSKPSIRESVGQILIEYAVFGKGRIEAENQILDLITTHLLEELKKHNTPGEYIYTEDIINTINNIKK